MTPADFRSARVTLGFTTASMAVALGAGRRTVQHWERGDRRIPGPVALLVRHLLVDLPAPPVEAIHPPQPFSPAAAALRAP